MQNQISKIMNTKPDIKKMQTTVKLPVDLYDEFKILGIKNKINLQDLVNQCVYRYVYHEGFREQVDEFKMPSLSTTGSFTLK